MAIKAYADNYVGSPTDSGAIVTNLFVDAEKRALIDFSNILTSIVFDKSGDDDFAKAVKYALGLGLRSADLADAFGVSRATISRWSAGVSLPQKYARPTVIDWIYDWAVSAAAE